jgi:hypothetical protein
MEMYKYLIIMRLSNIPKLLDLAETQVDTGAGVDGRTIK